MKLALVAETFPPEINGVAMTLGQLATGLAPPADKNAFLARSLDLAGVVGATPPAPRNSPARPAASPA